MLLIEVMFFQDTEHVHSLGSHLLETEWNDIYFPNQAILPYQV